MLGGSLFVWGVIAGVWLPVSLLIDAVTGSGLGDGVEPIGLVTVPAITIAFILLGYALQADSSEPLRLPSPDPSQPHRRACLAQEIGPHFDLLKSLT